MERIVGVAFPMEECASDDSLFYRLKIKNLAHITIIDVQEL